MIEATSLEEREGGSCNDGVGIWLWLANAVAGGLAGYGLGQVLGKGKRHIEPHHDDDDDGDESEED